MMPQRRIEDRDALLAELRADVERCRACLRAAQTSGGDERRGEARDRLLEAVKRLNSMLFPPARRAG